MTKEKLNEILKSHELWRKGDKTGVRANLRCADLRGTDLRGADLRGANLRCADLRGTDLRGADLRGADLRCADLIRADLSYADLSYADLRCADLRCADLIRADLSYADLSYADLRGADLRGAYLRCADLSGADLSGADLRGADLSRVYYDEYTAFFALQCPEVGSFIGFKKASGLIVKIEIQEDSKRSSATSRKCRCSKAKVLSITNLDGTESEVTEVKSDRDSKFVYKVGEIVEVKDFDENRWEECSTGIHFFLTRDEAVRY